MTSLLEGVITSGTGTNNGQIGRPAAGKTGTTDQHYDAWFDGYIPQLASAVWVGDGRNPTLYPMEYPATTPRADGEHRPDGTMVGGAAAGHGLRWRPAHQGLGGDACVRPPPTCRSTDFPPADLRRRSGVTALVPNVAGMDLASATAALSAAGFTPVDGGGAASGNPPGTVAFTTPGGGFQRVAGQRGHDLHLDRPPPPPPTKAPVTKKPVAKTPVVKPSVKVKAPKH